MANAPQSNIVAAAEHTIALMLALARNVPQAHASLTAGRWERSRFGGVEVYEKTLGVLGFGRIGQLVAARARAFGMRILAYDPFVSAERFRELGAERAEAPADLYAEADFITIHLPRTPETRGWLDAEAFAQCRDGVRVINCARGELVDDAALKDALDSGKVAGAALDVFPSEPITDYPLFDGYRQRRRHAAPRRLDDRGAGPRRACRRPSRWSRRSPAASSPRRSTSPRSRRRTWTCWARSSRWSTGSAGSRSRSPRAPGVERVEVEYFGRIAERDTRLLTLAVLQGVLAGHMRGGRQPRQRAEPRRGARHRRLRAQGGHRARLHRPRADHDRRGRRALPRRRARRSAAATGRTCSRPGASASTSSSTRARTSRCSATATCRG